MCCCVVVGGWLCSCWGMAVVLGVGCVVVGGWLCSCWEMAAGRRSRIF